MTQPRLKAQIAKEIYIALERLGAKPPLLSIIGSYGDTLGDHEILVLLQKYNATGEVLHRPQQRAKIEKSRRAAPQRLQDCRDPAPSRDAPLGNGNRSGSCEPVQRRQAATEINLNSATTESSRYRADPADRDPDHG